MTYFKFLHSVSISLILSAQYPKSNNYFIIYVYFTPYMINPAR
jgi:hypothetical protein